MTIGKVFYYILLIPALLATGIFYFFHLTAYLMEMGVEIIEDLMEQIKEF